MDSCSNIITAIGLFFNLIATIFLSKGLILKEQFIQKISKTYYGGNKYLYDNLRENKNNAIIGFIFLIIGFILQFVAILLTLFF